MHVAESFLASTESNLHECFASLYPGQLQAGLRIASRCLSPLRMDQKTVPDLSHRNDVSQVVLYGVFTDTGRRKVRYAVSLDEEELAVHKISCTVDKQNKLVLHLKDCVGCRAYRGDDKDDTGAYFSAYFYPFKRRWMSSRVSRQRLEQCFWVVSNSDPGSNLEEAEKWARVIRERAVRQKYLRTGVLLSNALRPCRLMILVNPQSGRGQALALYYSHVQHMLIEAGIPHTLVITERQNHARELVKEADLSQWNALVIMSGDGLLFEVVNGLLERADWQEAIRTPLGILPGGSGNALAASIHHYTGAAPVFSEELLLSCSFLLCKGAVSHMDLVSVHLPSGARTYSFLSLAWGFVADVDVESEKYRHMGGARFTVGTLVRLASLRAYRGRLAYLPVVQGDHANDPSASSRPASPLCRDLPCRHGEQRSFHNSCHSNNSLETPRRKTTHARTASAASGAPTGPTDSLLPPLDQPLPSDWAVVPDQDFVLVLAMYQSHLAEDLLAAPGSALSDGAIHLFYVTAGISRGALLRLFLAMETGAHLDMSCQNLVYAKVQALRLEPLSPKGVITVDGEVVEYGSIQAQVHTGLARLITG